VVEPVIRVARKAVDDSLRRSFTLSPPWISATLSTQWIEGKSPLNCATLPPASTGQADGRWGYLPTSLWPAERQGPPTASPQHKASARVIVVPLMFSLGIRALLDHLASTLSQRLILAYLDDIYTHGLCFLRPRHTSGIVVPQTGLDTRRYASVRALDCGKA
jgi:hypothetical protein